MVKVTIKEAIFHKTNNYSDYIDIAIYSFFSFFSFVNATSKSLASYLSCIKD